MSNGILPIRFGTEHDKKRMKLGLKQIEWGINNCWASSHTARDVAKKSQDCLNKEQIEEVKTAIEEIINYRMAIDIQIREMEEISSILVQYGLHIIEGFRKNGGKFDEE